MISIYIPRIHNKYDKNTICKMFHCFGIALISSVVFTQINRRMKKAIISIEEFYETKNAFDVKDAIEHNKAYYLWIKSSNGDSSNGDSSNGVYWILRKNKCMIKTLNEDRIKRLEDVVARQSEQIERLQQSVEQLFVGHANLDECDIQMYRSVLYNEGEMADKRRECLFLAYKKNEYQGDECFDTYNCKNYWEYKKHKDDNENPILNMYDSNSMMDNEVPIVTLNDLNTMFYAEYCSFSDDDSDDDDSDDDDSNDDMPPLIPFNPLMETPYNSDTDDDMPPLIDLNPLMETTYNSDTDDEMPPLIPFGFVTDKKKTEEKEVIDASGCVTEKTDENLVIDGFTLI